VASLSFPPVREEQGGVAVPRALGMRPLTCALKYRKRATLHTTCPSPSPRRATNMEREAAWDGGAAAGAGGGGTCRGDSCGAPEPQLPISSEPRRYLL
jgi:hypothetical protein